MEFSAYMFGSVTREVGDRVKWQLSGKFYPTEVSGLPLQLNMYDFQNIQGLAFFKN